MKLRHLRAIMAVANCGTLSAASRELGLSQPAVTRIINVSEAELATRLFHRTRAGAELTVEGDVLVAAGARAFRRLSRIESAGTHREDGDVLSRPFTRQVPDHELAALVAVSVTGSLARAAETTGLTQTALSRSMAALSSRLNRPLFEQAPPKRLTEWARDAAFNARQALREIAEAEAALRGRRAGGRATVRLRVGALPASRVYLVPEAARRFAADHAACEVSILDADYETLLSHLRSGEIELVIGSIRPGALPAWTAAESLFQDHLVVASRPDHPLQGLPAVDWWDLRSARWVLPGRRTPIRLEFDRLLASNGIPAPAQIVEVDSFIAARAFLLTGEWLGIFSASQIIPEERAKLLKRLPMSRLGEPRRVGAMTRRHETASAQLKAFLAHLRDAAAELARDLRHGSSRTKPAGPKLIWRDRN